MSLANLLRQSGIAYELVHPEYQRTGDAPVYLLHVLVEEASPVWDKLRGLIMETHYWPILGWDHFKTPPWTEVSTQSIIEEAEKVDVRRWFSGMRAERAMTRLEQELPSVRKPYPILHPLIHSRFTPAGMVPIALIPTTSSWQAPAYFRMSEDALSPQLHVAVLRYWHEQWKAEVHGMDPGNLEVRILNPPTTWHDAKQLAIEHYLYCEDIVDQGTHQLNELANSLLGASIWRFWWD